MDRGWLSIRPTLMMIAGGSDRFNASCNLRKSRGGPGVRSERERMQGGGSSLIGAIRDSCRRTAGPGSDDGRSTRQVRIRSRIGDLLSAVLDSVEDVHR